MNFGIVVLSPAGFPNPRLAAAAAVAGFNGGISLECLNAAQAEGLEKQLLASGHPFTLAMESLAGWQGEFAARLAGKGLERIVLTSGQASAVEIAAGKALPAIVLVEVVTADESAEAVVAGADGLIVKGNESGGRVGEETTFLLLQRIIGKVPVPVWARGGIGLHTSAACLAAGAAGVVVDWQLGLVEESNLPEAVKAKLARMDGSETSILGQECTARFRAYARPSETAFHELRKYEETQGLYSGTAPEQLAAWRGKVGERAGRGELLLVGQDGAFAPVFAENHRTVKSVCQALLRNASRQVRVAARQDAFREGGPLTESQGTRYPILQGPMTRVSDRADFALAVADGGGLPFLALALMRGPAVGKLLAETKEKLGTKPWGVGILGFVPKELRDEQLAEVKKCLPPFAVIAGGRPDMAKEFEKDGVQTYLHVPSPELLRNFLESGARRIIFEGRECGGHVGPRSSFVLWDQMVRVILAHLAGPKASKPEDYNFVFAGGIHDALSTAMTAAITAPLAERGVKTGVLLGTGYLFTHEAVTSGAISRTFQQEAVRCSQTILVESGVGHATRCANTPFGDLFNGEKRRLSKEGAPKEEIREKLEGLNLGRLRIASKGVERRKRPDGTSFYEEVNAETQRLEGMFMIGQVAALRNSVVTVADLHAEVVRGGNILRARLEELLAEARKIAGEHNGNDVAIVGLSAVFPQANDADTFWQNILHKRSAITEVPKERWDLDVYFDSDRRARDKVYSRWGGFMGDFEFDPMRFGMPPASVPSIEPMQLIMLEMVRRALADAGYDQRKFNRERTACIVGTGGGVGELGLGYGFRSMVPHYVDYAGGTLEDSRTLIEAIGGNLPEWTEDSFAGLLLNVVSGRVANRFDFGGTNYIVDAACATALAGLRSAVTELQTGSSDVAVAASADMMQSPFGYLCFSKTQALSPTGLCRTFDDKADGIVISEGFSVAILKRLEDAILDGDHVYALVKAVGASSDGKDKGLTAPRPLGQMRALERAYAKSGIDPATVGLIEAHGTGTVVGDRTETEALTAFFSRSSAPRHTIALGSVKSQIGHTKCSAGFAGLVKAAYALRHKVLPPTINVTTPNAKANWDESPLFINTEPRPWMARLDGASRSAGVSAFGFGGTNFHTVLSEYRPVDGIADDTCPLREWPAELFLMRGKTAADVTGTINLLLKEIEAGAQPALWDLAAAVYWDKGRGEGDVRLAIVAESLTDLTAKLKAARPHVEAGKAYKDPKGIYFSAEGLGKDAKVAFLFPGQGSQSPDMLRDLSVAWPAARRVFERADAALGMQLGRPLSSYIFPAPAFRDEVRKANEEAIKATNVAQPALGAADLAMFGVLEMLGITPDMAGGHSYGEFAALAAAGAMTVEELTRISELRGRVIIENASGELGTMAAVDAGEAATVEGIAGLSDVWLANLNAPKQTVIAGTAKGIDDAVAQLKSKGVAAKKIAVACAFHSKLVAGAKEPLAKGLADVAMRRPRFPVYSNTTARPHGDDVDAIRVSLAEHLVRPVRFADELAAMHDAGARIFIECGPAKVLTGLAAKTLEGRPFHAVAMDQSGRNGLVQMAHALGQLSTAGVPFYAYRLFEGRVLKSTTLARLLAESKPEPITATAWVVRAGRSFPAAEYQRISANGIVRGNVEGRASGQPKLLSAAPPAATPIEVAMNSPRMTASNGATAPGETAAVSAPVASAVVATPQPAAVAYTEPMMPLGGSVMEQVVQGHHQLMSRFLDTHRTVMMSMMRQVDSMPAASVRMTAVSQPMPAPRPQYSQPPAAAPAPAPVHAPAVPVAAPAPVTVAVVAAPVAVAAPLAAPAPSVAAPAAPARVGKAEITEKLVNLVSQRTGYPPEMLGLDQDLEADLGVDSIKRVEIFGALQNESLLPASAVEGEIESLSKLKTLQAIIDWVEAKIMELAGGAPKVAALSVPNQAPADESTAQPAPVVSAVTEITRLRVEAADAPLGEERRAPLPKFVLITDDGGGVSSAVSAKLNSLGIRNQILRGELSDPVVAHSMAVSLRETNGAVEHLIHLKSLAPGAPGEYLALSKRLESDLMPLYLLTREFASDMRKAEGGGTVLSVTRLGGIFGFGTTPGKAHPIASGSVAGFAKSVAREWPETAVRAVDFDAGTPESEIADRVVAELLTRDVYSEVGYLNGKRQRLLTKATPVGPELGPVRLTKDSIVLVTGGARGITAEITLELAEYCQPKFILLGRSPLPPEKRGDEIDNVTDDRKLKALIIDRLQTIGQRPTPAIVEGELRRIKREREILANIAAIRATGATLEYHAVDVCDTVGFGALIDRIYEKHGAIDAVIHGAGVIEDKLLEDKTAESFRRVLEPKVLGAEVLARKLRPESLQLLVFFSSVSARYGNRGQSDYSAANEVLNKLAHYLNAHWPGRVVSFDWGPWKTEGGMVSAQLAERFAKAGVEMIDPPGGRRAFLREVLHGTKEDFEVVFGGPLRLEQQSPGTAVKRAAAAPQVLLGTMNAGTGKLDFTFESSAKRHIYLCDHEIDGRPVMPMAMMLELFAEVAAVCQPGTKLRTVRDMKLFRGITLKSREDSVAVQVLAEPSGGAIRVSVRAKGGAPIHYEALVETGSAAPAVRAPKLELRNARPLPLTVAEAYEAWLFHGPLFAGIVDVEAVGDNGIVGTLRPSLPATLFADPRQGEWAADPVVIDSGLQMIILWARTIIDQTPLPSRLGCYHAYAPLHAAAIRCEIEVDHRPGSPTLRCQLRFFNERGDFLGWMEDMEVTASKALNRTAKISHAGTGQ
ncbi:MAG: SDR family NAD(P)-dependent oxidoreductase [Bryobacteraceae bacterium]